MDPLSGTLILILVALLGARFAFSTEEVSPGPRLLFRTGTHFLLIGFALGPSGLGLLTPAATSQLSPFLALGLGWVGFHFGLQLHGATLAQFPWTHYVLALGQALLTFLFFLGGALIFTRLAGLGGSVATLLALVAACTASITTPAGIAMVSSTFLVKGRVRDLLFFISSIDAVVGVIAIQLTYSIYRPETLAVGLGAFPQPTLLAVALGLGLVCGIVFLWLARARPSGEELVLYILGISAFSAGAALQWGLSPLFVSVTMGTVVANLGGVRARTLSVLQRWEKPVYVWFLLIGGALLEVPTLWVLPAAVGYAILRSGSKVLSSSLLVRGLPFTFKVPTTLGLGLIPQGGISIAMAISGVLVYSDLQLRGMDAEALLFAVIVVGVVLSELVGPFLSLRLLRACGEASSGIDAEEAPSSGKDHSGTLARPDGGG